jgi:hypothetical protein
VNSLFIMIMIMSSLFIDLKKSVAHTIFQKKRSEGAFYFVVYKN